MKKEIFAALLLAVILTLSIINTACIDKITGTVSDNVAEVHSLVISHQWSEAEALLEETIDYWRSKDDYIHSVLNHEAADYVTDDLFELLGFVYSQDDAMSRSHSELILESLEDLRKFEHIHICSIF